MVFALSLPFQHKTRILSLRSVTLDGSERRGPNELLLAQQQQVEANSDQGGGAVGIRIEPF